MYAKTKDSGIQTADSTFQTSYWKADDPDPVTFKSYAMRRRCHGFGIPKFHERKKRGELLPHTTWFQSEWMGEHLGGNFRSQRKSDLSEGADCPQSWRGVGLNAAYRIQDFPDFNCEFYSSPDLSLCPYYIQKAAAEIYAAGMDLSTFVLELPSLRSAMRSLNKSCRKVMSQVERKNLNADDIQDAWMNGRYGLRTVAYDVKDLNHSIENLRVKRKLYSERQGNSYSEYTSNTVISGQKAGNLKYDLVMEQSASHSIRGSVSALITPPRYSVNLLRSGWEAAPLSFILDWAIDVGTAIEAASLVFFAEKYHASYGFFSETVTTYTLTGYESSSHYGTAQAIWRYTSRRNARTPTGIPLTPQLTQRVPTGEMILDLRAITRLGDRSRVNKRR